MDLYVSYHYQISNGMEVYRFYKVIYCALSLAAQCIVIGLVCLLWVCGCVYLFVCLWVCYHDNSKLIACIDPHQTGFVGKGSDHLS